MISDILTKVRETKPLVHHITNWVTIYDCANVTRAFGALPVMAHAKGESGEMAKLSSSLVLNIGTLTPELIESMIIAGVSANVKGIPVILDIVGVGATKLRDDKTIEILDNVKISVIKGNSSEIARLSGMDIITRGVESTHVEGDISQITSKLSKMYNAVVAVTGKTDIITDDERHFYVNNGHPMMASIVGTGCMSASVIGAFSAVESDIAMAAASALVCFGIAGELAAVNSKGPGSFKSNIYDEIYNLEKNTIERMARIEQK